MKVNEFEIKVNYLPVILAIKDISRNGLVDIGFNQDLEVPEFNEASGVTLKTFDVLKNLFDVIFVAVEPMPTKDFNFTVSLKNWTATDMQIQLNFSNPLLVSRSSKGDEIRL